VVEDSRVEVTDVIGSSEPGSGLVAQPQDLALPDEVTQGLAGQGDVAVYLGIDEGLGHGRVREREPPGPRPAPAACVQAGIDDQPDGAPGGTAEHAEPLDVVGVQAELVGQPLSVQAPSLAVRHDVERRHQQGQVWQELQAGELRVVSGHSFVECRGLERPGPSLSGVGVVEQVRAGPRTVGLLVVYANRALHMTRVDVRLGLLYSAGELGGLLSTAAVPMLIKRLAIGRLTAAFLAANAAALAFLAVAPSYGWAVLAFFFYELAYVMVITTGITVRQMLTPDHLQARVNTAGRMIAWGGSPVGAVLGGLLAEFLPIRLAFGLLTISAAIGAALAVWSCLGSRPLSAVSLAAPSLPS
jgi:hypothetical protein